MAAQNALASRLRSVIETGLVADAETWCDAAGLSRGFLSSFFVRSKTAEDASMRGESVERLARAAKVNPTWLLTGDGPREHVDATAEPGDPYPQRAAAIARMRGLVSDEAIRIVRADQLLGRLDEAEWVEELLRADRIQRKGLERHDGQPHQGDGPVGRSGSKIMPRRR